MSSQSTSPSTTSDAPVTSTTTTTATTDTTSSVTDTSTVSRSDESSSASPTSDTPTVEPSSTESTPPESSTPPPSTTMSTTSTETTSSDTPTSPTTTDTSTTSTATTSTSSSSTTTTTPETTSSTTSETTTSSAPPTTTTTASSPPTTTSDPPTISTTPTTTPSSSPDDTSTTAGPSTTTSAATATETSVSSPPTVTESSFQTTTLSSTVVVTTTNSAGQTITTTPSALTSIITTTGSDGATITVTGVNVNPPLSSDSGGRDSSFFDNTGAVAGVFTLVGLAAASIILFILFYVRRRRRNARLAHDNAVSATLAAAGLNRSPLDDDGDDEHPSPAMRQMSPHSSTPSAGGLLDLNLPDHGEGGFNPYADAGYAFPQTGATREGYTPARSSSPPPGAMRYGNGNGHSGSERISHSASHSAGSYEPLLASYHNTEGRLPSPPPGAKAPTPPPRNPRRVSGVSAAPAVSPIPPSVAPDSAKAMRSEGSSVYSSESTGDDRLDPGLRQAQKNDVEHGDLEDNKDYSRPVLSVRNLPDLASADSRDTS